MVRVGALLLTVLTGFSGLVYEVAWQKYLATLLGSHSEATAAILAIFLGGLSIGYSLFGTVSRRLAARPGAGARTPALLTTYGLVEGSIGVWALLFPLLFAAVRALSLAVPHGNAGLGFAFDVGLTVLLIGPPTVLMGGTIPLLTQALAHDLQDATRFHAFVYAFNTAGAFCGALAAGFLLVPALGLRVCLVLMGLVNLAAGAAFLVLGRRTASGAPSAGGGAASPSVLERGPEPAPTSATQSTRKTARRRDPAVARAARATAAGAAAGRFALFAAVAFLGGFAMMAVQTVLNRLGGLSFGASHFTFSMVVAVFVLCIALGSFAVAAFERIPPATAFLVQAALAVLLALLYLPLQDAPYWAHELRRQFGQTDADFYPYHFAAFGALLILFLVPIGLSGASLPLLFHVLRREMGGLGAVAGRLYSWNTFGSVCGALLGGYALLFWLDLHQVYRLAVGALALAAALLASRLLRGGRRLAAYAGLAVLTIAIAVLPAWSPLRLSSGPFRSRNPIGPSGRGADAFFAAYDAQITVPFYDDDPTTSVAVWEGRQKGSMPSRAIVNNGKSDGEIPADYCTMALCGVLPALLADRAETAFVIGYGTGVTAGELAALGTVRRVDVAEIARGVLRAAPLFEYGNQAAAANPKVRLWRADAYRALVRSAGTYDIIASEPSNPWVTGVEMLFSREFLETARDHLSPGGVYAQWFHLYETDTETVSMVLRTYEAVFDQVAVWYAMPQDLLLLGFQNPGAALDLQRFVARATQPDVRASLARAGIRSLPALLAHEMLPLGALAATPLEGDVHTLFHPRLSHIAARAFFRGGSAQLPPTATVAAAAQGSANSLLLRYAAQWPGGLPDSLHVDVLGETLKHRPQLAATLLAQWDVEHPTSRRLAAAADAFWRDPMLHQDLAPADFGLLQLLLGAPGDLPACDRVARMAALFETYYHHGAPFRRDVLRRALERCADSPGLRAQVERRIGPLDAGAHGRPPVRTP